MVCDRGFSLRRLLLFLLLRRGLFLLLGLLGLLLGCLLALLLRLLLLRLLLSRLSGRLLLLLLLLLLDLHGGGLGVVVIVAAAHESQANRSNPGPCAHIQQRASRQLTVPHLTPVVSLGHLGLQPFLPVRMERQLFQSYA